MRKIFLVLMLVLLPSLAHAQQTINATSCSQSALTAAFGAIASATVTIVLPACPAGGTGAYTSQFSTTIPNTVTSLTIQGQTTVTCTGTGGTSGYACSFTPTTSGTVLTDSITGAGVVMWKINTASAAFRITGIYFIGGAIGVSNGKPDGFMQLFGNNNTTIRVDHSVFDGRPADGTNIFSMFTIYSAMNGVADHNVAFLRGISNGVRVYPETNGFTAWSQPSNFGQTNSALPFFFVENNVVNGGFLNDCNQGGRMVLRYNNMFAGPNTGDTGGWQGHQTSQGVPSYLGCRALETYHNLFTNPTPATQQSSVSGGGQTAIVYSNTIGAGYNFDINPYVSRAISSNNCGVHVGTPGGCVAPPGGYGYCGSGSSGVLSVWDGNSSSTGWPCLSQTGRGQGDLLTGTSFPGITNSAVPSCTPTSPPGCSVWPHQMLEPWYIWNETIASGNVMNFVDWNGTSVSPNLDAFSQVANTPNTSPTFPFNGTVGVGFGPLANRPTTCTAGPGGTFGVSPTGSYGVGYFATDQNRLYICTATNTWTFVYAPYVYPHPLVSGGGTPTVSLSPSSVAFGNVLVGSTSPQTTVMLSNTGSGTLTINPPIVLTGTNPADFNISNNCGTAVLAGGSCAIVVSCTPASAASFSANISITDNASGSPHTVPLTCTGVTAAPAIGFSPTSITFAGQTVGTPSSPTAVTVTNSGSANLVITGIAITGGNSAASFSQTNNCGTVAPAGTCTINVTFTPQVAGSLSSTVSVTDNAPSSPQSVPISGIGNGVAAINFNPTSLAFGNVTVGVTSPPLSTTVSNTGAATITLTSVTLTGTNAGAFTISANTCGGTIAVGASCVVSVTLTVGSTGPRVANLTFTDSAPGSPQNVALTGNGTQSGTSFSPTSLSFGNQTVSTASSPMSTVLTNTGSATLTINSISVTGANASDFTQTNNCPASIAPSANCTINVVFTPSATGSRTANVSVADNAPGSPQTVPLSGTGTINQVAISPSSLTFPGTPVGQSSPTQAISYSVALGSGSVTLSSIAITGGNSGDFSQTNNCPVTVPENSGCQIVVKFTPTATGARSSAVVFVDTATGSPHSVAINGTGTQSGAVVSPTSVTFPNTPIGTTSASSNVTLQNNGTATLNIASILVGGTNSSYFAIQSTSCGSTLAAGSSCNVALTFSPQTAISATGTLTFTDDGPGSPQVVNLSGLGTFLAVSFSPSAVAFGNQAVSTTSPPTVVTMTNNGNGAITISSVSITGTNASDFTQTNNCGSTLGAGASCTFNTTFTPSTTGSRTASLSVTDNAPGSPQTVALSGTGFTPAPAVTLSMSSLTFGNQTTGTQSNPQVVILTNSGTASLTISSTSITGTNAGDFGSSTTCGGTLAVGGSCTYSFTFTPTAAGGRSATFNLTTNAASSPDHVSLSGTGVASPQGAPAPQVFGVSTDIWERLKWPSTANKL